MGAIKIKMNKKKDIDRLLKIIRKSLLGKTSKPFIQKFYEDERMPSLQKPRQLEQLHKMPTVSNYRSFNTKKS